MAQVKTNYSVEIADKPACATGEGVVSVEIIKFAPWFEMTWNRQKLTHGVTAKPARPLVVDIPVEGALPGEVITPSQLSELLVELMRAMLLTCGVFVESVEDDFGYSKKTEDF